MAVDSALLDLAERKQRTFLRLYQWSPPCLSFGRHEPATRRYDRARIAALNLDCVRRPTGGRAVWHSRELTYAVAAPLRIFGRMRDAYHAIHAMLADALTRLGVHPILAGPAPPVGPGAGACFGSQVGGEVLVNGTKVIGSAQLRQGDAFLQHGSLLLEDDQFLVHDLTQAASPSTYHPPAAHSLGRPVGFHEAALAVTQAAQSCWGEFLPDFELGALVPRLTDRHAPRFRSPEWTWER